MLTSLSKVRRIAAQSALAAALAAGLVGCADVITFSKQTQAEGLKYYEQGQYADAAGAFRNSVRQDPRNYKSHYYLGQSQEQLKAYQKAIAAYKTALDTAKTTVEGRADLAFRAQIIDSLARVVALSDDRQVEIDEMERQAQATQSSETYLILAKTYRYLGDADTAMETYNRAALHDPNNFEIHKEFGLYLAQLGQSARAETMLRRAYSMNPNDEAVVAALRSLGIVPGPSIRDESQLAKPLVPKGPIPQVRMPFESRETPPTPPADASIQAPRD